MIERRRVTRLDWDRRISLTAGACNCFGIVEQISLKNAEISFFEPHHLSLCAPLMFSISLTSCVASDSHVINAEGVVARVVSDEKIAIEFKFIDIDSFSILKELLIYNFGEQDLVFNDLKRLFIS